MSKDNRSVVALVLARLEIRQTGNSIDKAPAIAKRYRDNLREEGLDFDSIDPMVMSKLLEVLAEI